MANFKIMRNGLNTEIVGDPHIGQSSEDVTVTVTDDGTYTGYEKKLYYSYGYRNQIYRAIADENESNEFVIPMTAFLEPGIVKLSLELSNGTNKPTCNACFIIATDGAKSVAASDILPDDATWEQYVASYVKSHADMLKGEKGPKGDTGDPGIPTDEQTQKAVNSWLTEHPEATTTVVDGSITPEKTNFMQILNIGSGNYNIGNPFLSTATYEPKDNKNAKLDDYYGKILDVNYSSFGKLLNSGSYPVLGRMLMVPISEGEYWLRLLSRSRILNIGFAVFDHYDIIKEPTQYETLNYDLHLTSADWTDYEGHAHSGEINLGEWSYADGSGSKYGECFVHFYKVTVPKGKYAFLLFKGEFSAKNFPGISQNYDLKSLYTIFDYDPTDNILEIVNSDYDAKSLTIAESMMKGFVKTLFKEKSVMKFFVDNANDLFPEKFNKHTFGKTYVAIGDSLTQYSGGDGKSGVGFLTQINKYLGMEIIQKGYAGSNWTGTGAGDAPARIQSLINEGVSYDVITLAWGTNSDADNGTVDDAPSKTGTMVAVMKWAINSIREKFPFTQLGIIIPPDGASAMHGGDKANLMIEVCKLMRVPYLDLYYGSNIIANNNVSGGLGSDQVHLYTYGRNRYASALGQFVEKICPYVNHYKVTYNLTNVTSSRTDIWWSEGDSFSTTLTASTGSISYVKVTMKDEDITSSVYADTKVNISRVTGDIVITATV